MQLLLWLHGGPRCHYADDCSPLRSFVARCGSLVRAPNCEGSTGHRLAFMDRVLAGGCGVADPSDCVACAEYLESETVNTREPRRTSSTGPCSSATPRCTTTTTRGGAEECTSRRWRRGCGGGSPLSAADAKLRAPIWMLHGNGDVDVPCRQIPPFTAGKKGTFSLLGNCRKIT